MYVLTILLYSIMEEQILEEQHLHMFSQVIMIKLLSMSMVYVTPVFLINNIIAELISKIKILISQLDLFRSP